MVEADYSRRNLVKAAALLLAEIDRIDRHKIPHEQPPRNPPPY